MSTQELQALLKEASDRGDRVAAEKLILKIEQIKQQEPKETPVPADQGYIDRLSAGFKQQQADMVPQWARFNEAVQSGNIKDIQKEWLYTVGQLGGATAETAFSPVKESYKELPESWRATLEKGVEQAKEYFRKNVEPFALPQEAIDFTSQNLEAVIQKYPRQAALVEDAVQIASLVGASKLVGFKAKAFDNDYAEMMIPKRTPTVTKKLAKRTVKPRLGKERLVYNKNEIEGAVLLENTPGVKPGQNVYRNIQAIRNASRKTYGEMLHELKKANIQFKPANIQTELKNNLLDLYKKDKYFALARERNPGRIPVDIKNAMDTSMGVIRANKQNMNGLLRSRIQIDELYNAAKTFDQFGTATENAKSTAFKKVRDTLNEYIIREANKNGVDVSTVFKKYSLYKDAETALTTKTVGKTGKIQKAKEVLKNIGMNKLF